MKILVPIFIFFFTSIYSFGQSPTYKETRKLLSKMERVNYESTLSRLFSIGDERIDDLISALNDSDETVSLNAQIVIRALGNKKGLQSLYESFKQKQTIRISLGSAIPLPLTEFELSRIENNFIKSAKKEKQLLSSQIYALVLDTSENSKALIEQVMAVCKENYFDDLSDEIIELQKALSQVKMKGKDVAKLVMENAFFIRQQDKNHIFTKFMAFNNKKDKALVYLKIDRGVLAEEWFHIIVDKVGDEWKFHSIYQVAVS